MPDLSSKFAAFQREQAQATTRNINHSRPATTAPTPRTATPIPAASAAGSASGAGTPKRNHDDAFNNGTVDKTASSSLLTQFNHCIDVLKKDGAMDADRLINKALLVNTQEREGVKARLVNILRDNIRCRVIPASGNAPEMFAFRPIHPVSNAEELKNYLARQTTAEGVAVKELKEGWADAVAVIDQLEKEHFLLAVRNKKDGTPKRVWADSPAYHTHISDDFKNFWTKTKLPATENEIQTELKNNGITATSQIKEIKHMDMRKKDRKRPNRRGGKTTNSHMAGILKDYSRK